MTTFCVNPLSANNQCHDLDCVLRVVGDLVACFKYLHPAIQKKRIKLIYDAHIEQQSLIKGRNLLSAINSLQVAGDDDSPNVRRLWFLYTKNGNTQEASRDSEKTVRISSSKVEGAASGSISTELFHQDVNWLSFGGQTLTEVNVLNIVDDELLNISVQNAYHLESLKALLPRYEPSDKHRKASYYDSRGEYVAAMPLYEEDAQRLLLISIQEGSDRWAYHETQSCYYRYKPTHIDQHVYHGFIVKQDEVPQTLQNILNPK